MRLFTSQCSKRNCRWRWSRHHVRCSRHHVRSGVHVCAYDRENLTHTYMFLSNSDSFSFPFQRRASSDRDLCVARQRNCFGYDSPICSMHIANFAFKCNDHMFVTPFQFTPEVWRFFQIGPSDCLTVRLSDGQTVWLSDGQTSYRQSDIVNAIKSVQLHVRWRNGKRKIRNCSIPRIGWCTRAVRKHADVHCETRHKRPIFNNISDAN